MNALSRHRWQAGIGSILVVVVALGCLIACRAAAGVRLAPAWGAFSGSEANGGESLSSAGLRATASPGSAGGGKGAQTAESAGERINILLMGIDARVAGEQDRTDTLVLLSLDKKKKQLSVFSIPRDSRVRIPGRGLDKINHAHAFGGIPLTVSTVTDNFGLPVDHWIRVDMPSMAKLLDVIGPITVNVPYALSLDEKTRLVAGPQQMDKELAMAYLSERYNDPRGDLGRVDRCQLFLLDLAGAIRQHLTLTKLPALYSALRACVTTDIGLREAVSFASTFEKLDLAATRRGRVAGRDLWLDGVYYYEVDSAKTDKALADLGLLSVSSAPPVGPATASPAKAPTTSPGTTAPSQTPAPPPAPPAPLTPPPTPVRPGISPGGRDNSA